MARKVSCIVLAAGAGKRFGGRKLLAELDGVSLIERTLDKVPTELLTQTAVVSGDEAILSLARKRGFLPVENHLPEEGISRSIRLGMEALEPCDALLFMVGDQPLLRRYRVAELLEASEKRPERIIALSQNGRKGNPAVFPAALFPELLALEGDRGGSAVMQKHPSLLQLIEVPREELLDVDTQESLQALQQHRQRLGNMLQPQLTIRFYTGDKALGPGIIRILKLVSELGTLRAAADAMAMSYSNAWTKVKNCERALGIRLMDRTVGGKSGGGTTLTEDALRLIEFYEEYAKALNDEAERLLLEFSGRFFPEEK